MRMLGCLTCLLLLFAVTSVLHAAPVYIRSNVPPDPALEAGMRAADMHVVVLPDEVSDWATVSKFHIWLILDWNPDKVDREALRRFLDAGGGVLMSIYGSDLVGDKFPAWNALLAPYGAAARREQVVDRAHDWRQPRWGRSYAWSSSFLPSPVTRDITTLWYPDHTLNGQGMVLGNARLLLDEHWSPLVRTMPEGGAYTLRANGAPDFTHPMQSAPPLLALRTAGAGRLAVQSFPAFYNFSGGSTLMVDNVVLDKGDGMQHSDGAQLLLNLFHWLGEPAQAAGTLGGYRPETQLPQKPWPGPPVTWQQWEWMRPRVPEMVETAETPAPSLLHHFRGLLGAHSVLSNGAGTVAELSAAAREAGYDFIIFTEHLPEMTAEKYDRLTADCRAASTDKFLALPGLDVQVCPWDNAAAPKWNYLIFGFDKFPEARYLSADGSLFAHQFDNWYFAQNSPGVAVHSLSARLPVDGSTVGTGTDVHASASRGTPEPVPIVAQGLPGWFYPFYNCFSLFTYRAGTLVDDAEGQYRRVADNGAYLLPVVTHLCYSPEDIRKARQAPFQLYVNIPGAERESAAEYRDRLYSVSGSLQFGRGMAAGFRTPQPSFVSSGPMLEEYAMVGGYPFDLQCNDRARLVVGVSSAAPLRAITISDGERPYRRVAVQGRQARVAAEDYLSRYWHFIAGAEDVNGGRLITSMSAGASYHIWARMCTDQQNIIAGAHLYFKGHSTLVRVPATPPNTVRFWAGSGDDGPGNADWNAVLCADVHEQQALKGVADYAPPEFHLELASPSAVVVDADQRWQGGREQTFTGPADPLRLHLRTFDFLPAVPSPTGSFSNDFPDYYRPHPARVGWALLEGEAELTRDVTPAAQTAVNLRLPGAVSGTADECAYLPVNATAPVIVRKPAGGWNVDGTLADGGWLMLSPVLTGSFCLYPLTPGMTFSLRSRGAGWELEVGYHLEGPAHAGQRFPVRLLLGLGIPGNSEAQDLAAFTAFARDFGLAGAAPFYRLQAEQGQPLGTRGLLELQAKEHGFLGRLRGADSVREPVGVRIHGLNPRWDAGVYSPERGWLRRIGFVDDVACTSLEQTLPNVHLYAGNLLLASEESVSLRLLASTKTWCRFAAHNSGERALTVTVRPAPGFAAVYPLPRFTRTLSLPAGSGVTVDVGTPPATPWQKVYDGSDCQAQTGAMRAADAGAHALQVRTCRAAADQAGLMMYEQWAMDEPTGVLTAVFRLKVAQTGGAQEVARLEVRDRTAEQVLASRLLHGADFAAAGKYQDFPLSFTRPATGALDYRVYWSGQRDLTLDTVSISQQ